MGALVTPIELCTGNDRQAAKVSLEVAERRGAP
jgi:hypothetical protein